MRKILVLTLLSSTLALPVFAADSGPYVALDLQNWSTTNNAPLGNPALGFRIGAGYHFTPNIGAEIDYAQSGNSSSVSGVSYKASAVQAAAIGTYPINDMFDIYAKLGMTSNKATISGPATCNSCSKTSVLFGVGGQYNINKQVGIRLEYDNLGNVTNSGSNDLAASSISVGAVYNF